MGGSQRRMKRIRNQKKRSRKWKRAIVRNGKIIATPPGMLGKYRAYPLLSERNALQNTSGLTSRDLLYIVLKRKSELAKITDNDYTTFSTDNGSLM